MPNRFQGAYLECVRCPQGELVEAGEYVEEVVMAEEEKAACQAVEEKVCTRCEKPKPLEEFRLKAKDSRERISICTECKRELDREYKRRKREEAGMGKRQRRRMEAAGSEAATSAAAGPENGEGSGVEAGNPLHLTISFEKYPEVLESIKRIAEEMDRTPEAQVRWWLRHSMDGVRENPLRYSVLDCMAPIEACMAEVSIDGEI